MPDDTKVNLNISDWHPHELNHFFCRHNCCGPSLGWCHLVRQWIPNWH